MKMTDDEISAKQTEILAEIPEEFRSTLSYMAYEKGHSAGCDEVLSILRGFVWDLKPAIKEFEKRILIDKLHLQGKL